MIVQVYVKPNSKKGPLVEFDEYGCLTVYVREPARQGKATEAVMQALARHFSVSRSQVSLRSGAVSRYKYFSIDS